MILRNRPAALLSVLTKALMTREKTNIGATAFKALIKNVPNSAINFASGVKIPGSVPTNKTIIMRSTNPMRLKKLCV